MVNSRDKGARAERELAAVLRVAGFNARRGQQYSGANGDADVIGVPGYHIECKHVEALNIQKAMDQSRRDARPGEVPIVAHRKNRTGWLVTMDLTSWLEIMKGGNK